MSNWLSAKKYTGLGESVRERERFQVVVLKIFRRIFVIVPMIINKHLHKAYLSTHMLIRVLKT